MHDMDIKGEHTCKWWKGKQSVLKVKLNDTGTHPEAGIPYTIQPTEVNIIESLYTKSPPMLTGPGMLSPCWMLFHRH